MYTTNEKRLEFRLLTFRGVLETYKPRFFKPLVQPCRLLFFQIETRHSINASLLSASSWSTVTKRDWQLWTGTGVRI